MTFALLPKLEVDVQSNELMNVLLGDHDIGSIFFEFDRFDLAKLLHIGSECPAEHVLHSALALDIVPVKHLFERLCDFWLPLPQVVQIGLFVDKHFVAGPGER